jgi:hypothetical protein
VSESRFPATAAPGGRELAASRPGWSAGRIAGLAIGVLLLLVGLTLLGGGGAAVWADQTQRDGGYATTDVHEFSAPGSALATVSTDLGTAGVGWLYSPGLLDEVRIRVTPLSAGQPLFVGIGPSADVDRYLAGVNHTVVTEFWQDEVEIVDGGPASSAPGTQDFWVASDAGTGTRTVEWDPSDGAWTVVVMNANAAPGLAVGADLGARFPALFWIAFGVLAAGAIFTAGGALLIADAIRRGRRG